MKGFSWGALILTVLGLLIAITPYAVFPVCAVTVPAAAGGIVPMKCFWTARAVLGVGGIIACSGLLLFFIKNPAMRLGMAFAPFAAGLLTVLIPNKLIGVCPGAMMACRMGTLPALTLLGSLVMAAAVCIAVNAKKRLRPPA